MLPRILWYKGKTLSILPKHQSILCGDAGMLVSLLVHARSGLAMSGHDYQLSPFFSHFPLAGQLINGKGQWLGEEDALTFSLWGEGGWQLYFDLRPITWRQPFAEIILNFELVERK